MNDGRSSDSGDETVAAVVARLRRRFGLSEDPCAPPALAGSTPHPRGAAPLEIGEGIFTTVDEAVRAARQAFMAYQQMGLDRRCAVVDAVRRVALDHAGRLARDSVQETGMGRVRDKVVKIHLVADKAPGPEDLEPHAVTGDAGMMVTEWAPFGVIGAVTPVTNPASTIVNNTISIISAGNSVTFNAHPGAKRVSAETIRIINRAIVGAGGPSSLVTGTSEPTIDSARVLMNHPDISVLLVTGGPGVVREALKAGKRAVTAGPGNPPVVVDETADVEKAGRDIVAGASFDNNIVCIDEKEVFAVASVADQLIRSMTRHGAYLLKDYELERIGRLIFAEPPTPGQHGRIRTQWVGKDADQILSAIGVGTDRDIRLLVAETAVEHPLVWTEQLLPLLPVVRVRDVDRAIELAVRAEHGFHHTASIFSKNFSTITRMARAMNCSIFVANAPNYAGLGESGEGFTSFSIASPSGDGLTRPRTFSRERRITVVGALRIV